MQVTTANFLPGECESDPCWSRFSDGPLVRGHGPNLVSKVFYILLIISIEPIGVGHVSFSRDGFGNWCNPSLLATPSHRVEKARVLLDHSPCGAAHFRDFCESCAIIQAKYRVCWGPLQT